MKKRSSKSFGSINPLLKYMKYSFYAGQLPGFRICTRLDLKAIKWTNFRNSDASLFSITTLGILSTIAVKNLKIQQSKIDYVFIFDPISTIQIQYMLEVLHMHEL